MDGCVYAYVLFVVCGCGYYMQERDFVRDYLGPVIRRDHPDVNIMIWDHNKVRVWFKRGNTALPASLSFQ